MKCHYLRSLLSDPFILEEVIICLLKQYTALITQPSAIILFLVHTSYVQVLRGHECGDGLLGDYCDGSYYKSHPLFSQDQTSLQIHMYYDDVEVCNPLGSRAKKHKLGKLRCKL